MPTQKRGRVALVPYLNPHGVNEIRAANELEELTAVEFGN